MIEAQNQNQEFNIQRIYIEDLSLESPGAPEVFLQEWKPEVAIDLDSSAKSIAEGVYLVVLSVTTTVHSQYDDNSNKKPIFLAEVKQAGIFTAAGFKKEDLEHLLGSFCPGVLFPYAREVISSLSIKAGFPPLYLAPINFDAYYAEKKKQISKEQETISV